jgi:hypothetical protein
MFPQRDIVVLALGEVIVPGPSTPTPVDSFAKASVRRQPDGESETDVNRPNLWRDRLQILQEVIPLH